MLALAHLFDKTLGFLHRDGFDGHCLSQPVLGMTGTDIAQDVRTCLVSLGCFQGRRLLRGHPARVLEVGELSCGQGRWLRVMVAHAVTLSRHSVWIKTTCAQCADVYPRDVPKLWNETIEAHRREVRAAVITAATTLVAEHGLRGVTMSGIAARAGIGRATLYKYFSDVESILGEWHQDQVAKHLTQMQAISSGSGTAQQRLARVLEAFAHMMRAASQHNGPPDIVASLHTGDRLSKPETELRELLTQLIDEGVEAGELRDDIPSSELALHCLNAAAGTRHAGSQATVRRLLDVAMTGLARPVPSTGVGAVG